MIWKMQKSERIWENLRFFQILSFSLRLFFSNSLDSSWFSFSDSLEFFQIPSNFSDTIRNSQDSLTLFSCVQTVSDPYKSFQIPADSSRFFKNPLGFARFFEVLSHSLEESEGISKSLEKSRRIWKNLNDFAGFWSDVEKFERIWKNMECEKFSENVRESKKSEEIWNT